MKKYILLLLVYFASLTLNAQWALEQWVGVAPPCSNEEISIVVVYTPTQCPDCYSGTINWYVGESCLGTPIETDIGNDGYFFTTPYVSNTTNFEYSAYLQGGPCLSYTLTVIGPPAATGSISGSNSVCQNQSGVTYSVPPIANATSYTWVYSGSGATITGSTNSVTISFLSNATSGNLTVSGVNSCDTGAVSASYPITVNVPVEITANASQTIVCAGQSVTLTGGGASNYAWSGGVIDGVPFVPATSATYTVSASDTNSCSASASVAVTVNANPTTSPTATPLTICVGGNTTLAANASSGSGNISTFSWSNGLGGNVSGGVISPSTNTSYNVTVTNSNGCSVSATTSVTVNATPFVMPTAIPTTICSGDSTTLAANATTDSSSISTYQWGSGLSGNVSEGRVSPIANATYAVTVTNINSCTASGSVAITVSSRLTPTINISGNDTICSNSSDTFTAVQSVGGSSPSYQWKLNGSNIGNNGCTTN